MKELMMALMLWASSYTGLPLPEQLPEIKVMDRCQLYHMRHPGTPCPDAEHHQQTSALYLGRVIYLSDEWKYDNLQDVTILLHELVHHVQYEAGVTWQPMHQPGCILEVIEKPAYDAHLAFLKAAGVEDPHAFMGTTKLYVFYMTKCLPEGF